MRRPVCVAFAWLLAASGCAMTPVVPAGYSNPLLVPAVDRDFLWDQLVDVVDNYFQIDREQRVRLEGDILTVGRLDTFPEAGSTLLEPFRGDSANPYEKLESTLQSIRRRAVVQVFPSDDGYLVEVAVYKELEDVPRPEFSTAGTATLRHDTSQAAATPPIGPQPANQGWIPLGRDAALEQRILSDLLARMR